jgi:ADP-ribose diphosphatase
VDPYYVLEYPGWVNVLAITDDSNVILVRQYRHGIAQVLLELPCGSVGEDESPDQAIYRELMEETGFAAGKIKLTGIVSPNPATHTNETFCFLAQDCKKVAEPRLDPNENIEVVLVPLSKIRQLTLAGEIKQALHVASIMFGLSALEDI